MEILLYYYSNMLYQINQINESLYRDSPNSAGLKSSRDKAIL